MTFKLRNPPKKADLTIDVRSNPNPVMVGANFTYTLTVTNLGPDRASSAGAGFNLPTGTRFVSCSSSVGYCSGPSPGKSGSVFASFGRLDPGGTATVSIVALAALQDSSYFSTAGVGSLTYDPDPLSNNRSHTVTVFRPNPNPLTQVSAMAAGGGHRLALKLDGSVLTWGDNFAGQLGDGTQDVLHSSDSRWAKIESVRSVAAGNSHSLAIKPNGNLWSWGANGAGQLGDGTTTDRPLPARVGGIANVRGVAGGLGHTIAVKEDGTVWTWGSNASGQLGNNTTTNRLTPAQLPSISGVTAVAAGFSHSAALRSDGTVLMWGENADGQLGDGTFSSKLVPTQVPGLTGVIAIAADGNFTIALKSDKTVWSWGSNNFGQLGDGTNANKNVPVQVTGLTNVNAIASGVTHCLALRSDGRVWAWGDNNNGRLGIGMDYSSQESQTRPLPVVVVSNAVAIDAGGMTSLALTANGTLFHWGAGNNVGYPQQANAGEARQILSTPSFNPDGGNYTSALSVTVSYPSPSVKISSFSVGTMHTAAVTADGKVYSWGGNNNGQLGGGPGLPSQSTIPVQAIGINGVAGVSAGGAHTVALKTDGTVWGWGNNESGQLGNGTGSTTPSPVRATGLTNIIAISAGIQHTLALRSDGTVWAWGNNTYGGLGNGAQNFSELSPVQVIGLTDVKAIAAGAESSFALKTDGTVWSWGRNLAGELGNGSSVASSPTPVQVSGLTNIESVATGVTFSLARRNDGTLWSWGSNIYGQLGDGTNELRRTPVKVAGLNNVVAVAAGGATSMARLSNGTVWTWGENFRGQLGNGTNVPWSYTPVQVSGLTNPTVIDMGGSHAGALASTGKFSLWGDNDFGQLGDGTTVGRLVPTEMTFFGFAPVIHYTTNGAEPTNDDPVIASGSSVRVDRNMVLKAKAFRDGFAPSAVKSGSYIINGTTAIQLSLSTYSGVENSGSLNLLVTRTGDTSGVASVNYATSDTAALTECNVVNGIASSRCDYATTVGMLRFAAGEASRTIVIPIVNDGYAEGNEAFSITLSNPVGATLGSFSTANVTIQDNETANGANPLDTVDFFIEQHYIDFLGRNSEPGRSGRVAQRFEQLRGDGGAAVRSD